MEKETIVPVKLMELKDIMDIMVKQSRIDEEEAEKILAKAGLTRIEKDMWKDENGSTYKFKDGI